MICSPLLPKQNFLPNGDEHSQIKKQVDVSVRSKLPQKNFNSPFWAKVWTPNRKFLDLPMQFKDMNIQTRLQETISPVDFLIFLSLETKYQYFDLPMTSSGAKILIL